MCPIIFLLPFVFLALLYYYRRRYYLPAMENINTISDLLQSPQIHASIFNILLSRINIKGIYKGRKIVLRYIIASKGAGVVNNYTPSVELLTRVKQPFFVIDYLKVTENTRLRGKYIDYINNTSSNLFYCPDVINVYSRQEFTKILDDLIRAAEIAESGFQKAN